MVSALAGGGAAGRASGSSVAPQVIELRDPTPATARRAASDAATQAGLDPDATDGMLLAVSEVVTNAHQHGVPPVAVVIRPAPGRVVIEVTDAGPGPEGRYLDVAPAPPPPDVAGGRGRWLAHRSCAEVVEHADAAGFTVRLTARPSVP